MKVSCIEDISDIFNVFHDGGISRYSILGNQLCLEIDIEYLAERIDTSFSKFVVCLCCSQNIIFEPWYDEAEKREPHITALPEIFVPELQILSSYVTDNGICINCSQSEAGYGYCGGYLKLQVDAATVRDESGVFLSIEQLRELSAEYWNEWSARNA